MHTQPLISIITVCYNAADCITETLQSACSQSYPNIELVIVDGGSTDNTLDCLKPFADKIATLISEKDEGIYDAMNKGIKRAQGEWVYFLNAGDRFYNNQVVADVFSTPIPSDCGLIYGKVKTINEPTGVNYVAGGPVSLNDFYSRYPINHQATFTRRTVFELLGYYDTTYKLAADTEWFVRIFKSEHIKAQFVDVIVSYYDIPGASYHKRMQGYMEYLRFSRRHFPFPVIVKNYLLYPVIWLKVKLIRILTGTRIFTWYRTLKFNN
jgi:glycosyltransferase involved in cell wall biosynthesis